MPRDAYKRMQNPISDEVLQRLEQGHSDTADPGPTTLDSNAAILAELRAIRIAIDSGSMLRHRRFHRKLHNTIALGVAMGFLLWTLFVILFWVIIGTTLFAGFAIR